MKTPPSLPALLVLTAAVVALFGAMARAQINVNPPAPSALYTTDFTPHPDPVNPDPYRIINGETQRVDETWLALSGRVLQVHPGEGLRVDGGINGAGLDTDFFVVHLPVSAAEGDLLPPKGVALLVKEAGTYTYSTSAGSTRTIRKFDYGIPCPRPTLSPAQLAAYQATILARVKAAKEKVLANDQAAAARDDADGLERMAERYRDGNGVETNLIKARMYFMRADVGGSLTASNKLAQLDAAMHK